MDWLKATNQQIRAIVESDGRCPADLLHQAVEEAIRRNIFFPYMMTIIQKRISREYSENIMKTTFEDIVQVFNAKAFEALKWYKPGNNGFLSFWARFMIRTLKDMVRDSKAWKRQGEVVSMDDTDITYIHIKSDTNIERMVLNRLTIAGLLSRLSSLEKEIVIMRDKGYRFSEIGKELGFTGPYMHKAYNRALKKMREGIA